MVACSAGFSLILFDEHGETRKTIEIRFFLATFGSGFFLSFLAFQIFKRSPRQESNANSKPPA
jgi:hypothetical protein